MAKADPTRDYYADLGLTPGADITEINKQYRKLALKCHPDRNPGKELESNAKFQDIKSAQEILTDPVQRAKYDAERARVAHGYGYAPQRPGVPSRNPYQATSNFPPPPSRTQPRPAYASTPSSGANRYTNVPKASTGTGGREDARSRANAFRAFEHMNKSSNKAPRTPTAARPEAKPAVPPRPRSGWESFGGKGGADPESASPGMQRTQSTRASRKMGFVPPTSAADEPPVSGRTSYFNATRGGTRPNTTRSQTEHQPPPPPGPPPIPARGRIPDPLRDFRAQNLDFGVQSPRIRTPYSTKGGEKTYFSSGTLGRSDTMKSGDGQGVPERPRSTSPPRSRAYDPRTKSGYRTGPSSPERTSPKRTKSEAGLQPDTQTGPDRSRSRTPGRSNSSGDDQARSDGDSPTYAERLARRQREKERRARKAHHARVYPTYEAQASGAASGSEHAHASHPPHTAAPPKPPRGPPPAFADPWSTARSGDEGNGDGKCSSTYAKSDLSTPSFSRFRGDGSDPFRDDPVRSSAPPPQPRHDGYDERNNQKRKPGLWFEWRPEKYVANDRSMCSFTFAVNDDTFTPTKPVAPDGLRSTDSTERIDTAFSAAGFDGRFTSTGSRPPSGYFDHGSRSPGRVSPDKARLNGVPPIPPPKEPIPPISPGQATFRPEDWAGEKYVWDPSDHAPTSPNRGNSVNGKRAEPRLKHSKSRGFSKGGAVKRTPVPKSATVGAESDEEAVVDTASKDGGIDLAPEQEDTKSSSDSNAMDIDPSSPPHLQPSGPAPPPGDPTGDRLRPSPAPSVPQSPQMPNGTSRRPSGSGFTKLDLDDLRNVEPFAPASRFGEKGMFSDLSSTLPVDSRASAGVPVATDSEPDSEQSVPGVTPQQLSLPPVPRAPVVPKTLSPTAWELYLSNIRAYMTEWVAFNDKMLGHFNDRQRDVKLGLAATNPLGGNWLATKGEAPGGGYLKYMQGLEEDVRVREHWDVAWERHREAMRVFGRVRAKVVEGRRA